MRADIKKCALTDGLSEAEVAEVLVASGEAFTNAIEHGHVPGSTVEVTYTCDALEVVITISDKGGGLEASQRTWRKIVDKPHSGGWGRIIMDAMMDEVVIRIEPGAGATVVMRKSRRV